MPPLATAPRTTSAPSPARSRHAKSNSRSATRSDPLLFPHGGGQPASAGKLPESPANGRVLATFQEIVGPANLTEIGRATAAENFQMLGDSAKGSAELTRNMARGLLFPPDDFWRWAYF